MSLEATADAAGGLPVIRQSAPARLGSCVFSFPVFLAIALIALAALTVRSRFNDPDLWWHLTTGRAIWNTGSIPRVDLFSYTAANHAWTAHEWLSDVLLYATWRSGGYGGLMLLLCALTSAFCGLLYVLGWLAGGNPKVAFLGALCGWLFGTIGFALRPHLFGYLFLILELVLLQLSQSHHRRWLWGVPPLFALWVNCHPSHVLGLLVLAAYWLCSLRDFQAGSLIGSALDARRRRLFPVIVALSAAMLLVNPIGLDLPLYPFNLLLHQSNTLANVSEWRPLDLQDPRGLAMLAIAGAIFLLVLLRRAELRLTELAFLVIGMGFAIQHQRLLVVFGILAAPVLCRLLSNMWEGYAPERDSRLGNILAISLGIAVTVWAIPPRDHIENQIAAGNPVGAIKFIRESHLSGPMLNDYLWGGYLMWALPEHKVFIDGRADVFDWTGVLSAYGRWATLEEDPRRLLDKYGVNFCLLQPSSPISRVLPLVPGWREVYRDEISIIFSRH
jgi:hypothetical protein